MKKLFLLLATSFICLVGSAQWITQNSSSISSTATLSSVHFTSPTNGFIAGGGGLFKTTDAGNTWSNNTITATNYIRSVYFVGTDTGYAAGNLIYKTTDSGSSWNPLPAISAPFPPQNDLQFIHTDTGFIYEQHGQLLEYNKKCKWTWYNYRFLVFE